MAGMSDRERRRRIPRTPVGVPDREEGEPVDRTKGGEVVQLAAWIDASLSEKINAVRVAHNVTRREALQIMLRSYAVERSGV